MYFQCCSTRDEFEEPSYAYIYSLNIHRAVCFRQCRIFARMVVTEVVLDKVVVHPLVLLSVVDHFSRMGKIGNQKRVVGLLLGSWSSKGVLDIANSFAIPFDEDDKVRLVKS